MTGIYLKCDKCGATLGGEQVTDWSKPQGLHWSESPALAKAARERGWTGNLDRNGPSYCPQCTPVPQGDAQ
jgi:hypothetical protein